MQIVSPTMWKLMLIGITALAKIGSLVFLVAASIENGKAAALDIVVAPVMIGGNIFFNKAPYESREHRFAATSQTHK